MSARPRVLVTTSQQWREAPLRRVDALTGRNYADAALRVGLLPLLSATLPAEDAPEALDGMDGLLLSGGGDVDPARFGQAPQPGLAEVDPSRDAFELALYQAARRRGLPILAICRGIQLVAVAEGGTLHQHLPDVPGLHQHEQRARDGDPAHRVRLGAGSALAAAFGRDEVVVNSYHHQGVDRVPDALRAIAHADDGLVEALEAQDGGFLLAVQWHPEMAFERHPDQLAPFTAFAGGIDAAREGR